METGPLISICIPAYNAGRYIAETIDSLLAQTLNLIEICIVNDQSSDNTLEILDGYRNRCPDKIKILTSRKKGAAAARNLAYRSTTAPLVVFFDADDLIEPNFLESQAKCIKSNTEVVISEWGRFDNKRTYRKDPLIVEKDLTFEDWVINYWSQAAHTTPPGRVMAPRTLIDRTKLWDEKLSLNDDFQFFSNLFSLSSYIRYNKWGRFMYRSNNEGLSSMTKTFEKQQSNLMSLLAGIEFAELRYPNHILINKACANMLQNFIYDVFPNFNELQEVALAKIISLGGSDLKFPAGGYTRFLSNIVGWKTTKNIKKFLH